MTRLLTVLRERAGVRSLLSRPGSNPKVAKAETIGIHTAILHLAPADTSGHEVCPGRSPGCTRACLHYAGAPNHLPGKIRARIARTRLLFRDRTLFMNILALEIAEHIRRAKRQGMAPAIRLNGTSDICWEVKSFMLYPGVRRLIGTTTGNTLPALFPELSFYDYTALPNRRTPANYHLTFSLKETNLAQALAALRCGMNVAVVFRGDPPAHWHGYPVIDGDGHDYRPADPRTVVVGLSAKGKLARADHSGFVHHITDIDWQWDLAA